MPVASDWNVPIPMVREDRTEKYLNEILNALIRIESMLKRSVNEHGKIKIISCDPL